VADAASLIAERYARALFSLSAEQGAHAPLARDMQALSELSKHKEMKDFFATPLVKRAQKASAMEAFLAEQNAHALTRAFVQRIALNNRLPILALIGAAFARMLAESRGELGAEVISARALSPLQISALEEALAKSFHKKAQLQQQLDPSLMAGFVLRAGGFHMDYSLAGQLDRLGRTLKTHIA